jgi:hypothetical protein
VSRRARIAGFALLALVGAVGAFVASVKELRDAVAFGVAPGWAARRALVRLEDDRGRAVTLVGTIHGAHLATPAFGLWHLAGAVDRAAPEIVLVESRAEELARGNTCDGPVEMGFVTLRSRGRGLEVRGVDHWERAAVTGGRHSDDDREEAIASRVLEAIGDHRATIVFTGFSHTPEIAVRLRAKGFHDAPLGDADRARLVAPSDDAGAWPPGMAACLERRIADDEAALAGEADAAWRANLERNIAARRAMLATVRAAAR